MTQQVSLSPWVDIDWVTVVVDQEHLLETIAEFGDTRGSTDKTQQPYIAFDAVSEQERVQGEMVWIHQSECFPDRKLIHISDTFYVDSIPEPPNYEQIAGDVRTNFQPTESHLRREIREEFSAEEVVDLACKDLIEEVYAKLWERWKQTNIPPAVKKFVNTDGATYELQLTSSECD